MRKRLLEAVLAVVVEEAVRRFFPFLLPYVWTGILVWLSWEFLVWARTRTEPYLPTVSPGVTRTLKTVGIVLALGLIVLYWTVSRKISKVFEKGASIELAVNVFVDEANGVIRAQYEANDVGDLGARRVVYYTSGHIVQAPEDVLAEDHFYQEFEARNKNNSLGENTVGINQKVLSWMDFPVSPADIQDIQHGKKIFYIFTVFEYADDIHPRIETTSCIAFRNNFPALCRSGHNDSPL